MKRLLIFILTLCLFLTIVPASELLPEGYEELYPVEVTAEAPVLLATVDSKLEGKSILFFGDSLLSSYGLEDYTDSWTIRLKNEYGMTIKTDARSGSTIASADTYERKPGGCWQPYCERGLPAGDFDIIFVAGGGNDWYCEIPLGSDLTSRNTKTFVGAINTVIDKLQADYPDSLILFSTSWYNVTNKNSLGLTPQDYNDAMRKVCAQRGIPCFNASDTSVTGIAAGNGMFIAESDFWHLNAQGHAHYLPIIAAWLESQLPEEVNYLEPFRDVALDAWYADHVAYAYENGLILGTGETTFSPDGATNRAMLVTILYRASGKPSVEGLSHPFTDTEAGAYYSDALCWGYENSIIFGISEDRFDPEGTLTREQLAAILYRLAGKPQTQGDLSGFSDSAEVSPFAEAAMTWAVDQGILQGYDNGCLMPGSNATRAQLAAILRRYLALYPISA